MRLEVDVDKCTGHGICESIAEDVFEVQYDGMLVIDHDKAATSDRDRLQQAVIQCPAAALRLAD
ncbi:MAG TPA: ferredoxin [Mycobacterium sp.]